MNDSIIGLFSEKMYELGTKHGFPRQIIRSNRNVSEIYMVSTHALQLEIDWRNYDVFLYVVYLRKEQLPKEHVIYRYDDGTWCRKYIEEIYRVKRPQRKNKRFSIEGMLDVFDFYVQLIDENPETIFRFLSSPNGSINKQL